jgi:hypothetical protein
MVLKMVALSSIASIVTNISFNITVVTVEYAHAAVKGMLTNGH